MDVGSFVIVVLVLQASFRASIGLGLEDGHIPTFWLLPDSTRNRVEGVTTG